MYEADEEEKFKQENLKNNWKLLKNILLEVQNATQLLIWKAKVFWVGKNTTGEKMETATIYIYSYPIHT